MYSVDLNSDIGESFGAYKLGDDEAIIRHITAANAACGWHGGDPMVMDRVVRLSKEHGVAVGAHPGYPDLMGFGRRRMTLSFEEAKNYVKYQIGALSAFTVSYGIKLHHVAPHGAMGNQCQYDEELSRAVCEAVYEFDRDLIIYYCAGAVLGKVAEDMAPRKMEGAMITDEDIAIGRCVRMIKEGKVTSINGKELDIKGDTLCVHGDGPKAMEFVRKIRKTFEEEGIQIKTL